MANTTETYLSDGLQAIYNFNFDYISKDFIKVLVDAQQVGWTLTGTYQITLDVVPEAGKLIIIQRETSQDRIVDFVDGSILVAKDMNLSALQAIHIAAEAFNKASGSLLIDDNGNYTAGFRRVADLGDPVDDRDAVTKVWAESALTSELTQAVAAKDAANVSAGLATTKAADADAAAVSATALAASTAQDAVDTAADVVSSAANATAAASSATAASGSASNAATSEANAATSEANAAASAVQAATFNPADYPKLADTTIPSSWVADQAEAEAGTDNTVGMTPLRTAEAIGAQCGVGFAPDAQWRGKNGVRSGGTSYRNTTGYMITVNVWVSASVGKDVSVSTNGSTWVNVGRIPGTNQVSFVGFNVMPGHYYKVAGTPSGWAELSNDPS